MVSRPIANKPIINYQEVYNYETHKWDMRIITEGYCQQRQRYLKPHTIYRADSGKTIFYVPTNKLKSRVECIAASHKEYMMHYCEIDEFIQEFKEEHIPCAGRVTINFLHLHDRYENLTVIGKGTIHKIEMFCDNKRNDIPVHSEYKVRKHTHVHLPDMHSGRYHYGPLGSIIILTNEPILFTGTCVMMKDHSRYNAAIIKNKQSIAQAGDLAITVLRSKF